MVRCGICLSAFNALDRLFSDEGQPIPANRKRPPAEPAPTPAPPEPPSYVTPKIKTEPKDDDGFTEALARAVERASQKKAETQSQAVETHDSPPPAEKTEKTPFFAEETPIPAPLPETETLLPEASPVAPLTPIDLAPPPAVEPSAPPYSELPALNETEKVRKPIAARLGYGFACVGLTLLALFQVGMLERTVLVKYYPDLRPLFEKACKPFACTVPFSQEINAWAIVDHDLRPDPLRPGFFILSGKLKNQSNFIQALPHIDLSLNDAQTVTAVRRVLSPAEWSKPETGQISAAPQSVASLSVIFQASDVPVVGYFIQPFYP